jgi:hypothetical protein
MPSEPFSLVGLHRFEHQLELLGFARQLSPRDSQTRSADIG